MMSFVTSKSAGWPMRRADCARLRQCLHTYAEGEAVLICQSERLTLCTVWCGDVDSCKVNVNVDISLFFSIF